MLKYYYYEIDEALGGQRLHERRPRGRRIFKLYWGYIGVKKGYIRVVGCWTGTPMNEDVIRTRLK